MKYTVSFVTLLILIFPWNLAAEGSDPYYAFEESWALSQRLEHGRYPITTFIPRTFLLFIQDRSKTRDIGGRPYLAATTQDGVDVFVDETTVSKKTFKKNIGGHEIIFNSETVLCRTLGCDKTDPDEVWRLHRGDAFKMDNTGMPGFYKLTADRHGNQVVGYIRQDDLENLTRSGFVTRADFPQPKYSIERTEGQISSTECGERRERGEERALGAGVELEISIFKIFGIGAEASVRRTVNITKAYGGANKKYSFFVYKIRHNRTNNDFILVGQVIYTCEAGGLVQPLTRIERVDLKDPKLGRTYSLSFNTFQTPNDLLQYTGLPYLFSVNSYNHYTALMDRLGAIFEDRALAGFFLSEFNRSCRSRDRVRSKCHNYSYRQE